MRALTFTKEHKAAKEHICAKCDQPICKGEKHIYYTITMPPDPPSRPVRMHRKCYYMQFFTSNEKETA